MTKHRVLIVEDSLTMRKLMMAALETAEDIEVVGAVCDPVEAQNALDLLKPDVITLDVALPKMNGLDFLDKIMQSRPLPVIMVSNHTQDGAEAGLRALECGAFACIGKPTSAERDKFGKLPALVRAAARAPVRKPRREARQRPPRLMADGARYRPGNAILAIGASTGGVEAIADMLHIFPQRCPPTVIAQHMPPPFLVSFAGRLDRDCRPRVMIAEHGAKLEEGHVYISPGQGHLTVVATPDGPVCEILKSGPVNGHVPSVDVLFQSLVTAGPRVLAALLTGMGTDGARGLLSLRQAGAHTFAQSQETCAVYGMPRAAVEAGAAVESAAPRDIAVKILKMAAIPRPKLVARNDRSS